MDEAPPPARERRKMAGKKRGEEDRGDYALAHFHLRVFPVRRGTHNAPEREASSGDVSKHAAESSCLRHRVEATCLCLSL